MISSALQRKSDSATHTWTYTSIAKSFVDIARGDLDSARSICEYMATDHAKRKYLPLKMDEEYNRITKELCPLIAKRDRAGLARLLHKYEEGSVRAMKLEKYGNRRRSRSS